MAEPTDDPSSTAPPEPRCPWCSAELADPDAKVCPSCQANLVGELDKQLPGLTAVDLEKLAFRRTLPQKKSRIMSWISGDLDYEEDSTAGTDANFVMTGSGGIVEVQGTAEGEPFSEARFLELMALARKGIDELVGLQKAAIA